MIEFIKNNSAKLLMLYLFFGGFCLIFEISYIGIGIDNADEGWHLIKFMFTEQLGSHFPNWQNTHKLAGAVDWHYHEDKKSLLIYLPKMTNE